MTRAVPSLSQEVSSANDEGTWAVALPPPVVPAACPKGVPTAKALCAKADMVNRNVSRDTIFKVIRDEGLNSWALPAPFIRVPDLDRVVESDKNTIPPIL